MKKALYKNVDTAPFVYFDAVAGHGITNGMLMIELAAQTLVPKADDVSVEFLASGRLRCSLSAALSLRKALDDVIALAEKQSDPEGARALN